VSAGGAAGLAAPAVQAFLAAREVAVLATLNPDGSPLAMPMWFLADAEAITMLSVDGLAKVRNLRADPRVSVVAEAGERGNIRGVAVQGRAEFLADGPARRALVERFHARYDPDLARLWKGRAMPPDRVMFRIVPARVRAWGLPPA
jgi:PPOX class probable F420-dependent enzyme